MRNVRALALTITLMAASALPAAANDATSTLLAQLASCDLRTVGETGPRLDLLLALADGRSGAELADLLNGTRACLGRTSAIGEGADETVFVGAASPLASAKGAVLWVDRGYWRAATTTLGYAPSAGRPNVRADGREYLVGIWSGGSAGMIGLSAVTISGGLARTTLSFAPQAEISSVRSIGDDLVYVTGRMRDPATTWGCHACWPGGAQWLFERVDGHWSLSAQRQATHPYYLITGFVGGMLTGDASMMLRFASPEVVASAALLPTPIRSEVELLLSYPTSIAEFDLAGLELADWRALPSGIRQPLAEDALVRPILLARNAPPVIVWSSRGRDGWRIDRISVEAVDRGGNTLRP